MKKLLVTMFAVAMAWGLIGCGELDGDRGPRGRSGAQGEQGLPGTPGSSAELSETVIGASRTYSPSSWQDEEFTLKAGVYVLPERLELTAGQAGTGWASIIVDGRRYCYQGNGASNSYAGTAFVYKGVIQNSQNECFMQTPQSAPRDFFALNNQVIEVQINGGGCSNCQNTSAEGVLTGLVY